MLNHDEKRALLRLARETVRAASKGAPLPTGGPSQPGAAFVTIHKGDELRGCIGHLAANQPLWQSVQEMAAAAATRDDRFDPVTPEEVDALSFEISVLSPMTKIDDPSQVQPGVHGLYVKNQVTSGLLLPQVAVERGWAAPEFLSQTCRKAGLPPDAWIKKMCEVFVFTAEILSEEGSH